MATKKVEERLGMVEEQIGLVREDLQRLPEMEKNMAALSSKIDLLLRSQVESEANRRKVTEDSRPVQPSSVEGGIERSKSSREGDWRCEGRVRWLEMPIFDGNNQNGWFFCAERFFIMNRLNEAEKLNRAVISLDGDALAWFQWANGRRPIWDWLELKTMIQERFRPTQEGSAYEQFLALRQVGTVVRVSTAI